MSGQFHAPIVLPSRKLSRCPLNGRLGDPRAGPDAVQTRSISCPSRESHHDSSDVESVALPTPVPTDVLSQLGYVRRESRFVCEGRIQNLLGTL